MHWFSPQDHSAPVIHPEKHAQSKYPGQPLPALPRQAVVFCLGKGLPLLQERFALSLALDQLPGFITHSPVVPGGGRAPHLLPPRGYGAPQAACTVETLHALGVRELLLVGLCGGFSPELRVGGRAAAGEALERGGHDPPLPAGVGLRPGALPAPGAPGPVPGSRRLYGVPPSHRDHRRPLPPDLPQGGAVAAAGAAQEWIWRPPPWPRSAPITIWSAPWPCWSPTNTPSGRGTPPWKWGEPGLPPAPGPVPGPVRRLCLRRFPGPHYQ